MGSHRETNRIITVSLKFMLMNVLQSKSCVHVKFAQIKNKGWHIDFPCTIYLQCSFNVVGMVCVTGVVNPWLFIAILPLCMVLVALRHFYIQTSRQLRRLEGVSK